MLTRQQTPTAYASLGQADAAFDAGDERLGSRNLDCFSGSGTTELVALREGRRFRGFDINPASVRLAERRVKQALPLSLKLSV